MLGNFFFGLTTLFYIGLAMINISKPPTGQNAMGYGLALAFLGLGFTVCSLVLTFSVSGKGGFDWVQTGGASRNLVIGIGWLSLAVTTFFCAAFKWEWYAGELPEFLHWLAVRHGQIWIPLLILVPCFFLLNTETRASLPQNIYKIPMILGFSISLMFSMGLLFGKLRYDAQWAKEDNKRREESYDNLQKQHLDFINGQTSADPILNMLALSGRFNHQEVRSAAIAKIKEKPDWKNKLIEVLESDYYYYEVYTFIDGNAVEHPDRFLEPLNRSILRMSNDIHKLIKESNSLQNWHFEHFGIERLFRAIEEQFLNKGMDFRPAIVKLQQALNTTPPERFKNVRFTVTPVVDDWLKKHK